jgi:hypothetical protein
VPQLPCDAQFQHDEELFLFGKSIRQFFKLKSRLSNRGSRSNIVSTFVEQLSVLTLKTVAEMWDNHFCVISNFPYTNLSFFHTVFTFPFQAFLPKYFLRICLLAHTFRVSLHVVVLNFIISIAIYTSAQQIMKLFMT